YDHTIAVDSGYAGKENLRIIHNGIRLVASSGLPADVTVTASDPSKPVIEVLSDNVQISGFLLSGATQSTGLYFHGSKAAEIHKSTVTGNRQGILIEDYSGLNPSTSENCTVAESTITGNTAGGVVIYKTDKNTVRNSTVSDPEFGVGIEDGIENTVAGNTFENCPEHAIWVLRGEDNAIRENTVVGGDNAILLEETAGAGIAGNRVSGATVGFALQDSDDTTLNDCHVTGAAEDAPSVGFRLDSSDRNIITNSSIGTIYSQNFRVTGVEVIGSSTANTIIDCAVTGITAPAITAALVASGAQGTGIKNLTVANMSGGNGGTTGIFFAAGSGNSLVEHTAIHDISASGNVTGIGTDRTATAIFRKSVFDRLNSTGGVAVGISVNSSTGMTLENLTFTRVAGSLDDAAISLQQGNQTHLDFIRIGDTHPVLSNLTVTGSLKIRGVESPPVPPEGFTSIRKFLEIRNTTPSEAAIRIYYTAADLESLNPSSLRIWRHADDWSRVVGENRVDLANQFVSAKTHDFSIFAPLAEPLRANFTANRTTGMAPLAVQFSDRSGGYPEEWAWSFGDGGTSDEQHPLYTYRVPGNYTVNLTVRNNGVTNTLTRSGYLTVTTPPPTVTGIIPAFGYCNETLLHLDVNGTGFITGASVRFTEEGKPDIPATNVTVISPSGITCTISLAGVESGNRSVFVTNPDNQSGTLSDGFRVRLRGDFNGNGAVDIGDVTLVAYMVVNRAPSQIPAADFNSNGIVDIGDAAKIAWFGVGKITVL
ncbi:MAG: right-handed parallel beta-helix repeat-containing protein, partial [Methanoregula sp.]